jgi:hypothetical protein
VTAAEAGPGAIRRSRGRASPPSRARAREGRACLLPATAQDFLVSLTLTYTGGGKGNLYSLVDMLHAVGSHNAPYDMGDDPCGVFLPAPDLGNQGAGDVFSGRTVTGNVCFQIASNDADSLLLDVGDPLVGNNHWFAPR